jgi:hypothetical protein
MQPKSVQSPKRESQKMRKRASPSSAKGTTLQDDDADLPLLDESSASKPGSSSSGGAAGQSRARLSWAVCLKIVLTLGMLILLGIILLVSSRAASSLTDSSPSKDASSSNEPLISLGNQQEQGIHTPQKVILSTNNKDRSRIVAIGDFHGDWESATYVLKMAGLIDNNFDWIGGTDRFVQTVRVESS